MLPINIWGQDIIKNWSNIGQNPSRRKSLNVVPIRPNCINWSTNSLVGPKLIRFQGDDNVLSEDFASFFLNKIYTIRTHTCWTIRNSIPHNILVQITSHALPWLASTKYVKSSCVQCIQRVLRTLYLLALLNNTWRPFYLLLSILLICLFKQDPSRPLGKGLMLHHCWKNIFWHNPWKLSSS